MHSGAASLYTINGVTASHWHPNQFGSLWDTEIGVNILHNISASVSKNEYIYIYVITFNMNLIFINEYWFDDDEFWIFMGNCWMRMQLENCKSSSNYSEFQSLIFLLCIEFVDFKLNRLPDYYSHFYARVHCLNGDKRKINPKQYY